MDAADHLTSEVNITADKMAETMPEFSDWLYERVYGATADHTRPGYVPADDVARMALFDTLDVAQLQAMALAYPCFAGEAMGRIKAKWENYCYECALHKHGARRGVAA